MSENYNKQRAIKNTLLLYIRMLFTMWLNLWATRLVLANLGIEEMGIYAVVGGIVNMFLVLASGVSTAIQRFITYEMGTSKGDLNRIFCSSLNVVLLLGIILTLILEAVGIWLLNNSLNIPISKMNAAHWVFHFSVFGCFITIISIPYNALILAHEKINIFAYITILQSILTVSAAYFLSMLEYRLLFYSFFMMLISVLVRIIYHLYCVATFSEARYKLIIDKSKIKQLLHFSGISTTAGLIQVISNQGIILVINWVFGVAFNAVFSIAIQVKNAVLSFALNVQRAVAPQITKTYASGEVDSHQKLVYSSCKASVFMILFIVIPFLFKAEYIIQLWLKDVPEHTVDFVRVIIFISLSYALFEPIKTSVLATNNIRNFLLMPDLLYIILIPACYYISNITQKPISIIITILAFEIIISALKLFFASKASTIIRRDIISQVFIPCLKVFLLAAFEGFTLSLIIPQTIKGILLFLFINSILLVMIIYIYGFSSSERQYLVLFIRTVIQKRQT